MTGNSNNKMRALFLSALMVLSVFAGTIALSGSVAASHGNTTLEHDGQTVWQGQSLTHNAQGGETYEVREQDGGSLVSQIEADSDGTVNIDTALTGTGKFYLEGPGVDSASNTSTNGDGQLTFEVVEQSFSVSANPSSVENAEGDSATDFEVSSNRANYQIVVSSEGLSTSELEDVFNTSNTVDSDSDGTVDSVAVTGSNSGALAGDFTNISAGNYTLQFDVQDTTASSTANVNVSEPTEAAVSFDNTVMVEERGDVVAVTLTFAGAANTATVTIGDSAEVNYEINATVTDSDGDGSVTLLWDTGATADDTEGNAAASLDTEGDNLDSSTVIDDVSKPVETGEYPVSVSVDGTETDIATAIVEERSTTGISAHTAPSATDGNVESLLSAASSAEQGNTIASDGNIGDWVLVQVEASGLESYVGGASDLSADSGNGVTLTIEESAESVGRNADPANITADNARVFQDDAQNDTYYVAFKATDLTSQDEAQIGDTFDVTFTVDDSNAVTDETETVSTAFQLVDGTSSFDTQAQQVFVSANEDAEVTGTSTWAPGTDLNVRLRSEGGQSPFVVESDAVVQPDGTWTAPFNLADKADGQPFSATLRHGQGAKQAEASGEIGELTASVSMSDQQAQESGTLVTVDSVTLNQGGFVAIHQESASGPVVGVSDYLEAGSHSDVRIRLDEAVSGQTTLVAMAHKDSDSNKQFGFVAQNGEEDGPYTSGGAPVTDSATASLQTPSPTATPTPTDDETPTPTPDEETPTPTPDEETPTDEPTPGFGLVVALLALAGAALLALRRD